MRGRYVRGITKRTSPVATIGRVEAHLPPEGLRGITTMASSARTTERERVGCGIPLTGQGVNHNIVLCEDHRGRGRRGLQGVDGWVRPLPAAESSQTTISWLTPR